MLKSFYKRKVNHLCPNCMSKMNLENGEYICSNDRLDTWKKEIDQFVTMDLGEKRKYLETIVDQDRFMEMYKKRDNLVCDYSTISMPITPNYNVEIPDPMVVGKIERSLRRPLTEEELSEGYTFYRDKNKFRTKPTIGYKEFKIPFINFPEDV